MKINDFRGDLSDISARKTSLLRLADLTHNSNICNTINMKQNGNVQKILSISTLLYGVLNVNAQHPASAGNDWRLFARIVSPVILFVVDTLFRSSRKFCMIIILKKMQDQIIP